MNQTKNEIPVYLKKSYQLKKSLKPITAALIANLIYLVIVLIFKTVSDIGLIPGPLNMIFQFLEFGVVSLYWLCFFWYILRNAIDKKEGKLSTYIILTNLPIIICMGASVYLMYTGGESDFNAIWTGFNFVVAPALFWMLPYGFIYQLLSNFVPIAVFMLLCLGYTTCIQIVGVAFGGLRRKKMAKYENLRSAHLAKEDAFAMAKLGKRADDVQRKRQATIEWMENAQKDVRKDESNVWNEDDTQIIYTDNYEPITDEMLEVYNKGREGVQEEIVFPEEPPVVITEIQEPGEEQVQPQASECIENQEQLQPDIPSFAEDKEQAIEPAPLESKKPLQKEMTEKEKRETIQKKAKEALENIEKRSKYNLDIEKEQTQNIAEEIKKIRSMMELKEKGTDNDSL